MDIDIDKITKYSPLFWQELSITFYSIKAQVEDLSEPPENLEFASKEFIQAYQEQEKVSKILLEFVDAANQIISFIERADMIERDVDIPFYDTNEFAEAIHRAQLFSNALDEYRNAVLEE